MVVIKRVVLALGGNALGDNLHDQMLAVRIAAKAIADLVEDNLDVVLTHGNGPQVGMINLAMKLHQRLMKVSFSYRCRSVLR